MGFMKRMLSSVGIGSAKVDTVLHGNQFAPGEVMPAVVNVKGGGTAQEVNDITFSIHTTYLTEREYGDEEHKVWETAVLADFHLGERFTLSPGEERSIDIELDLPFDTPITIGKTEVWVQTGMDISRSVDPKDRDFVQIVPGPLAGSMFDAFEQLGFDLVQAECEAVRPSYHNRLPFVQEFEYRPRGGPFRGHFDEVELVMINQENSLDVMMEIDRRARGFSGMFSEMLGTDESNIRFSIYPNDIPNMTNNLHQVLSQYS